MNTCETCPYKDFKYFRDYYGRSDYAHHWVESVFDKKATEFDNGNADFSGSSFDGMAEYIKKGTSYMNIFMYVIREFEDAIDDCNKGCVECNDSSVHAWDEGVCFYTGSLEGVDGSGSGVLPYALADKRCANFKVCGVDGTETSGTSKVNHDIFKLMGIGQDHLLRDKCAEARETAEEIIKKMYIPLIQGSIRYAYIVSKLQDGEKQKAEGSVFSAAVLPRIHAASPEAAQTIYNNMKVGATTIDPLAVKEAYESVYANLGITCVDVGGFWFNADDRYYDGMEPCSDSGVTPEPPAPTEPTPAAVPPPTPAAVPPTPAAVPSTPVSVPAPPVSVPANPASMPDESSGNKFSPIGIKASASILAFVMLL